MTDEKIFASSGHLTHEAMFRYHSHALSREDQYAIEKHMAGCRLCAEAMEGTEKIRKEERYTRILAELRRAVRRRSRSAKAPKGVFPAPITATDLILQSRIAPKSSARFLPVFVMYE